MTVERKTPDFDIVVGSITALFGLVNVISMMLYAGSLLGPVPFELIWLLLAASVLGAVSMLPSYLVIRRSSALFSMMIFVGLALFNYWCLSSASAAV